MIYTSVAYEIHIKIIMFLATDVYDTLMNHPYKDIEAYITVIAVGCTDHKFVL